MLGDSVISASICSNETYEFDGEQLNETGEYTAVYEAFDGSDSTVTLLLTVLPPLASTVTDTICAGETYSFFGTELDASGEYEAVLTGENGCDSTVTLNLTVRAPLAETVNDTICAGETYPFFGLELAVSGIYEAVLPGSNGCDSTLTLNLTVRNAIQTTLNVGICTGSSYIYLGDTLNETDNYLYNLTAANGCDSLVRLNLAVVDSFIINIAAVICNGESYTFGDTIVELPGIYVDSLIAVGGCDSIVTLTLEVLPPLNTDINAAICVGSSYPFHGDLLTEAGTYLYVETSYFGCDSTITLNLETVISFETALDVSICSGETYTFGTEELGTTGVYTAEYTAIGGCDSTVTLTLTVLPNTTGAAEAIICEGESFIYDGDTLTTGGVYEFVLDSYNGCDSVVTFTLTVLEAFDTTVQAVVCNGDSFFFYGETYDVSGLYDQVFTGFNGCDSTITLNLVVLPELITPLQVSICAGASYDFHGDTLDASGTYTKVLVSEYGCDSTINLTLTVLQPQFDTVTQVVCAGETYEFDGDTLTESGTYTAVFADENGCDSTVTLTLNILPIKETAINASVCEGGSYIYEGDTLTAAGVYTYDLTGEYGCDSTVTVTLSILPTSQTIIDAITCEGEPYNYFGQLLTESGSYEYGLTGANGCDSIIIVNLEVLPLQYGSLDAEICAGEIYTYDGDTLTETGVYNFIFEGVNGCDSIFIVYLTVHPATHTVLNVSECEGSTYDFYGVTLVASGSYIQEFTSIYGCDSTITLNLTFVPLFETTTQASVCAGESYVFGQDTLTESGEYSLTVPAVGGCDSVITLTLTVLPAIEAAVEASVCAGESYEFDGQQLDAAGTYTAVLTAANGCDSTVVLTLSILPQITGSVEASICPNGSYDFHGEILTEGGTYTAILDAANGCDSVVTLTLTILPVATSTASATICAGDTYDFNGEILNASGNYTSTFTGVNGCDSIVTLTLTVTPPPQSAFASVVCGGIPFEFNGEILTESGVYTFTLENASVNGCDSIVTLFLTIFPEIPPTSISASICAGESYLGFTSSGQYSISLPSSTGCDSIIVLNLTVHPASATAIQQVLCEGTPGVFTEVLSNIYGCDSIITTTVIIDPAVVTVVANGGTLVATSSANATYQWINCETNQPIAGAAGNTYTPPASGQYAVVVTNAAGCTTISQCITVTVVSTNEPLLASSDWKLQPNPAVDRASVVFKEAFTSDVRMEIFDASGRMIYQQDVTTGSKQIDFDVNQFPNGILMVRLTGENGVASKLLMKGN